ncbi:hypothetical protein [Bradyrhizobium sp. YR681]|uniref:hypothetical protein n=1 Tax=Bradyrhizobium sp. YR681 TaxID=1144344 RepID=UPI00055AC7F9|nr:hypothetical protein [Bradyrhizobium sp. YR681]
MASADFVEQYIMEEMKVAQARMSADIDAMNRYEVYAVTLVGAILALIFQYKIVDRSVLLVVTVLPGLVGIYGHFRCRAHANLVKRYNEYLLKIESSLKSRDDRFVGFATANQTSEIRSYIKTVRSSFWVAIIAISIGLTIATQLAPAWLANSVTVKSGA